MKKYVVLIGISIALMNCSTDSTKTMDSKLSSTPKMENTTSKNTVYQYNYQDPNDENKSFKQFEGKVILVVNTATQCGLTPQLEGLEVLHNTYSERGLVVLGFPCNQFGEQEPLSNEEMVETCKINHGVTFELTKKIEVNGDNAIELYKFLKSEQKIEGDNEIRWNFEKFLINKKGEVVKRFSPQTTPAEITEEIENIL